MTFETFAWNNEEKITYQHALIFFNFGCFLLFHFHSFKSLGNCWQCCWYLAHLILSTTLLVWQFLTLLTILKSELLWTLQSFQIIENSSDCFSWFEKDLGLNRDLNPGPLTPEAGIIPLDHWAVLISEHFLLKTLSRYCHTWSLESGAWTEAFAKRFTKFHTQPHRLWYSLTHIGNGDWSNIHWYPTILTKISAKHALWDICQYLPVQNVDPGRTQTCDPLICSQMPYPLGHRTLLYHSSSKKAF